MIISRAIHVAVSVALFRFFKMTNNPLYIYIYIYIYTQTHTYTYRRRQWLPTPVLLPGKSHGQRSLVGCCLWGRIESDTTERLHVHFSLFMHWRMKWQPTPALLPGEESQGRRSLVGCRLWARTESDTTKAP